jgi:hypothetical protein
MDVVISGSVSRIDEEMEHQLAFWAGKAAADAYCWLCEQLLSGRTTISMRELSAVTKKPQIELIRKVLPTLQRLGLLEWGED